MGTKKTAQFVKTLPGFTGTAKLYKLDPPMQITDWDDKIIGEAEYVVASATVAMFSGPETYLFPSTAKGEIVGWSELRGSYRGGLDHTHALNGAGYEVAP